MGMYTELVMGVELRRDVPDQVIQMLRVMLGLSDSTDAFPVPDAPLFQTSRWRYMLKCDSYYFEGDTMSTLRFDEISRSWTLTIRCNLKNYEEEIEKFIDWLGPWIATEGFYGYKRYEEAENPTLLYADQ